MWLHLWLLHPLAKHNANTVCSSTTYSASFKPFDDNSSNHTKDELESNLEALGISSGKGLDDTMTKDSTIHSNTMKNNNTLVDIATIPSQVQDTLTKSSQVQDALTKASQTHWSELKAKGLLKSPVNTNAVIPNTDADKKINDFLARYSSKGGKR